MEQDENLPLENAWCFWFDKGQKSKTGGGKDQYLDRLKNVGVFRTVMDFWKHFNFLRVNDMRMGANLMLFKEGLDPVWEHPGNVNGGKWVIPLSGSGVDTARVWEVCVLHTIGEQFSMSDSVCGVVLSRRAEPRGDSLCIWNNDVSRKQDIEAMREELVRVLQLPPATQVTYQPHKGHIDFGQQHPPLPQKPQQPQQPGTPSGNNSKRNSKRNSSREGSPRTSQRKGSVSSATPPVIAAAVAAAAAAASTVTKVTASMDLEFSTVRLEPAPESKGSPERTRSPARSPGPRTAKSPVVLVTKRPLTESPPEAPNNAASSSSAAALKELSKEGDGEKGKGKGEENRNVSEETNVSSSGTKKRNNKKKGAAASSTVAITTPKTSVSASTNVKKSTSSSSSSSSPFASVPKQDVAIYAVATIGVLIGILSLIFLLR